MKIILVGMAAVIVILVVALGAALMDKVDVLIQEEPTRTVPNPKPAFTQDENRQRQSQNQQRQKEELENAARGVCLRTDNMKWDQLRKRCVIDEYAIEDKARRDCERDFGTWDFLQKTCGPTNR
jgi:hypothetical protein